jgi:hypothetical protein
VTLQNGLSSDTLLGLISREGGRMPRKIYSPKTKAAIVEAAKQARASGRKWVQVFEAAKATGYTGSVQGIVKMLRGAGGKKRRGRKPGRQPAAAPVAKRGPGRPPKAQVGRPKGVGSIQAMIGKLVKQQVNGVLEKAIAVLKAAKP